MDVKKTIEYLRSVRDRWDVIIDNYTKEENEKFIEICEYQQEQITKKLERYKLTNPEEII